MSSTRLAPVLASLALLSTVSVGCAADNSEGDASTQGREVVRKAVPTRADQLFFADRVCKGILNVKHRPGFRAAVERGDQKVISETRRDLKFTGNALGKFPLPGIRSLASGHLKVAAFTGPKGLSWGLFQPLASLDELQQVAKFVGLPSCSIR